MQHLFYNEDFIADVNTKFADYTTLHYRITEMGDRSDRWYMLEIIDLDRNEIIEDYTYASKEQAEYDISKVNAISDNLELIEA